MRSSKVTYNLESTPNKDGSRLIFLNINYGYKEFNPISGKTKYKPFRLSTQKRVDPKFWDFSVQDLKKAYSNSTGKTIKNRMEKYRSVSLTQLEKFRDSNGRNPSPIELQKLVKVKLGTNEPDVIQFSLVDTIDSIIEKNESLTPTAKGKVGERQIEKYQTVRNSLLLFEKNWEKDLVVNEFDNDMFHEYLDFVNEQYKLAGNPHGYMVNTISKTAKTLVTLLRKIGKVKGIELGIDLTDDGLSIAEVSASDAEAYISESDLKKVVNCDTCGIQGFINAKNYIILCAMTSLRYQDMRHLHEVEVETVEYNGREFLGFDTLIRKPTNQSKKDFRTFIPVLQPAQRILEDNGGRFPKFPNNSSMNVQLKRFAKFAGLDKVFTVEKHYYKVVEPIVSSEPLHRLITCHMGRDSFVTNLSEIGVVPEVVMNISHPERAKTIMQKHYDKTPAIARAVQLLDELDRVEGKTELYRY